MVVGAALASALLLWLASPAVGLAAVAWIALVPAALVHLRAPLSRAGRLVVPLTFALHLELQLVPGLPFGIATNQWGQPPFPVLVGDSPVVGAAFVFVPLVGALLYLIRFPQPWPAAAARSGVLAVFVPALSWAALDLVRARYDPSGLWGGLFLSQHGSGAASAAALAGPWLLTLLMVAVSYALALAALRGRRALPATALVAGLVLTVAIGTLRLGDADGEAIVVAAIQPGYDTAEWDRPAVRYFDPRRRDLERATLDVIADLGEQTRSAAQRGAELVVWPEAVAWVDPAVSPPVRAALVALAREGGVPIVVPYFDPETAENAVLAVLPDGTLTEPEPKQRPMWFLGERAPSGSARPLDSGRVDVGVLLGVDNQDPGNALAFARRGAEALASATHDWPELATQQRALSGIAAAAVGLPLVRSDWRFGSQVLDSEGRVLADAGGERVRTALVATVKARASDAPYLRVGDALGWTGALVFLACWVGVLRDRRDRRA